MSDSRGNGRSRIAAEFFLAQVGRVFTSGDRASRTGDQETSHGFHCGRTLQSRRQQQIAEAPFTLRSHPLPGLATLFERNRSMNRIRFVFLSAAVILVGETTLLADDPIEIGSRRELFVDDHVIERISGRAQLRMYRPTPREIAIVCDKPWEGASCGYTTVFRDGDVYRMYYRGSDVVYTREGYSSPHREVTCYAESSDGIHWKKPELGLFEFEGSKKNNIVWDGVGTHAFVPFKDTNPDCKPDAKYKALGLVAGERGLWAFKSPDAIHWTLMRDKLVITKGAFDSQNLAFWDSVRGEYREYHRDFRNGRDIRTATSKDFVNWTEPEYLSYSSRLRVESSEAGEADLNDLADANHPKGRVSQLYTNQIAPYYRAPHIFFGFPTRYIDRGWTESHKFLPRPEYRRLRGVKSRRQGTAVTDGMFITSRDAEHFHVWPESFIRPGLRSTQSWFYGDNYQAWGLVATKSAIEDAPPEISIYVSENSHQDHGNQFRRHTLRIDGFVSVQAPLRGGELITKPLVFSGKQLTLNFATSAAGSIQVEIQNDEGQPIPGFALSDCHLVFGDDLARTVVWQHGTDVSKVASQIVRLRFVLRDADLFAFRFVE